MSQLSASSQNSSSSHPGTVQRALISVFDKTGLEDLARGLHALGIEILASGGTATALEKAGVPTCRIEAFTGAAEVLDGRVKTLHPKVHAGILADRRIPQHMQDLLKHGYTAIDLVVCNLYPFAEYLKAGKDRAQLVEKIDIGGPTLIRAAAKNVDGGVSVLSDPADYEAVLASLRQEAAVNQGLRMRLAAKAFRQVAEYDLLIAKWTEEQAANTAPSLLPPSLEGFVQVQTLRYGENPHQPAALYRMPQEGGVAAGTLLAGKPLSYNNLLDMDAAYRAAYGLHDHGCTIVKHTNPCGMAQAKSQAEVFKLALAGDPLSAFGGVIGFNQPLELSTVQAILESKLFVECIAAPAMNPDAQAALKRRENLRLFVVPAGNPAPAQHAHRIGGGLLVQVPDSPEADISAWKCVTNRQLEPGWMDELRFAMNVAGVLKSNSIAVTRAQALLGAGAGQMSRVDAAEQALKKAGDRAQGAFLGSDAFFPFPDTVELAAKAGIAAMVQPGGSKRDQESIDACDAHGIAMVFTGTRHFRH